MASEGYERRIGWTGDYNGRAGTVSAAFVLDVERRINVLRALCGVPANARVNTGSKVFFKPGDRYSPAPTTTKAEAAQQAALMLIRSYSPQTGLNPALNHDPPPDSMGWSPEAWNANAYGNLAFGIYGPTAIDQYVKEELPRDAAGTSWNLLAGHRRWILYPNATDFATGDQPGESAFRPPTNVLYVTQNPGDLQAPPTDRFISYPPAGFVPAPLNSPYWSLSRAGADFRSARVTVTAADGKAVGVTGVQADASFGDPALVWQVDPRASSKVADSDRSYSVMVRGILVNGSAVDYSYKVTFINPDRLTSDQSIRGPDVAKARGLNRYSFAPPPNAGAVRISTYTRSAEPLVLDAESRRGMRVLDLTDRSYSLVARVDPSTGTGVSGSKSFRLTFPTNYDLIKRGVPDQTFELLDEVIPGNRASVSFEFRRGFMTRGSRMSLEVSNDGGGSWSALGKPVRGVSDTQTDTRNTFVRRSLPKSAVPVKIRFRYHYVDGMIYSHNLYPQLPTGIYLDNIRLDRCSVLEQRKAHVLSPGTKRFILRSSTAGVALKKGGWIGLRMSSNLGGKWFPDGPLKGIRIVK